MVAKRNMSLWNTMVRAVSHVCGLLSSITVLATGSDQILRFTLMGIQNRLLKRILLPFFQGKVQSLRHSPIILHVQEFAFFQSHFQKAAK